MITCLFVSLLSHFWLIHFCSPTLALSTISSLCQATCVQSHQRQPMSAVAITACEVQVSAVDSQTVPTVATWVSKPLCCRLTLTFTLTRENLSFYTTLLLLLVPIQLCSPRCWHLGSSYCRTRCRQSQPRFVLSPLLLHLRLLETFRSDIPLFTLLNMVCYHNILSLGWMPYDLLTEGVGPNVLWYLDPRVQLQSLRNMDPEPSWELCWCQNKSSVLRDVWTKTALLPLKCQLKICGFSLGCHRVDNVSLSTWEPVNILSSAKPYPPMFIWNAVVGQQRIQRPPPPLTPGGMSGGSYHVTHRVIYIYIYHVLSKIQHSINIW